MRGIFNFVSGALLGGIIGATITLLLTPSSGEELRSQMQAKAEQIQLDVRQAAELRRAELEQQLAVLRSPDQPHTHG
jgi:gas vesicle protein